MAEYKDCVVEEICNEYAICRLEDNIKIRVNKKHLNKALLNDKILVKKNNNNYYFVQKIIERNQIPMMGKVHNNVIVPINKNYPNFFIKNKVANENDIVEFCFDSWNKALPLGNITKVKYNTSSEYEYLLKYDIPTKFPEDMEINEVFDENRIDLRHLNCLTNNYNNAISYEITKYGYRVYFHIFDIISYVKPGTKVDMEAYKRVFNIKYDNMDIPIIPFKKCRLNENEDNYTITISFDYDREWNLMEYHIYKSIINVQFINLSEDISNAENNNYTILNILKTHGEKIRKTIFNNEIYFTRKNLFEVWELIANYYLGKKIENQNAIFVAQDNIDNRDFNTEVEKELLYRKMNDVYFSDKPSYFYILGVDSYCEFTRPTSNYTNIINLRVLMNVINNKQAIFADLKRDCVHFSMMYLNIKKLRESLKLKSMKEVIDNRKYPLDCVVVSKDNNHIVVKTELGVDGIIDRNIDLKVGEFVSLKIDKVVDEKLYLKTL